MSKQNNLTLAIFMLIAIQGCALAVLAKRITIVLAKWRTSSEIVFETLPIDAIYKQN